MKAHIHVGGPNLLLPEQHAAAIHQLIPGSTSDGLGGFTIPCNNKATVAFTIGGQPFTIDPRDLVGLAVNDSHCVSNIAGDPNAYGAHQWFVSVGFFL